MRIINVKKLIISTLIFLFSSYHEPMLAGVVQPAAAVQESVVPFEQASVQIGRPQIIKLHKPLGKLNKVTVRSCIPSMTLMQELLDMPIAYLAPGIEQTPYVDMQAGWVISQTFNPLQELFAHPGQYTSSEEAFANDGYPKIFTAAGISSTLLQVPMWDERTNLALGFTLLASFLAFGGFSKLKGKSVHTSTILSYETCVMQCVAAAIAQVEELTFHTQEKELIHKASHCIQSHAGKSVKELIEFLLLG